MSDFALRVGNMPDETLYAEPESNTNTALRDETLRALLINHFENVIKT